MKRGKEFDNILDECLERLLVEGEAVEQCLDSFPEDAAELEPLLRTAMAVNKAVAVQPDLEFKARARYQFQSLLEEAKPKRWFVFPGWQPRWAVAIATFLAVVLVGAGTVMAADSSMPGNPLYPVKLATEQVRLAFTRSDIRKAELYATLADKRIAEIAYMVDKDMLKHVDITVQRLNKHLDKINSLPLAGEAVVALLEAPAEAPLQREKAMPGEAEVVEGAGVMEEAGVEVMEEMETADEGAPPPTPAYAQATPRARLRILLERYAVNHPAKLRALLDIVPESAKPALRKAIALSVATYKQVLEDLD